MSQIDRTAKLTSPVTRYIATTNASDTATLADNFSEEQASFATPGHSVETAAFDDQAGKERTGCQHLKAH